MFIFFCKIQDLTLFLSYVSVCEARVYPCPILSFHVEAQPKSRFSGIQCWSEADLSANLCGGSPAFSY